jgi:hypothetical protein
LRARSKPQEGGLRTFPQIQGSRHACHTGKPSPRLLQYKIVALVQGTDIVRRELGLPVADCLAADPYFSLVPPSN